MIVPYICLSYPSFISFFFSPLCPFSFMTCGALSFFFFPNFNPLGALIGVQNFFLFIYLFISWIGGIAGITSAAILMRK